MNYSLVQIIIAARKGDTNGTAWMQILVLVILAAFYVIGSIIKAKANKEEPGREPGFRPPEDTGAPEAVQGTPYWQVEPPPLKLVPPKPVAEKFAAEEEQTVQLQTIEVLEEAELPLPSPQPQPAFKELPEVTSKLAEERKDKHIPIVAETARAKLTIEPLLDYADPDKLRRAILHYEILGKPLSLRGPTEHIIGL